MASALPQHKPAHIPEALWHSVHAPRTPENADTVGAFYPGATAATAQAPAACALCGQQHHGSQLHFGVMGSFAYCTGCLLKVGAAYANGSATAEAALANFAGPEPRSQSSDATMRTCGTCYASKAISNFLRQDNGAVRLERDCNACAAAAARQQAQQLQLNPWHAAAAAQQQDPAFRSQSSAALLAQLTSVIHTHMAQQHMPSVSGAPVMVPPQQQGFGPPPQQGFGPPPQQGFGPPPPRGGPEQQQQQRFPLVAPAAMHAAAPPGRISGSGSLPRQQGSSRSHSSTESDDEYTPPPRNTSSAPSRGGGGGGGSGASRSASRLGSNMAPMKVSGVGKTHKTCSRCKQEKPASCYNLDRGKPDGLYCHCRACCAEMNAVRNQRKVLVTTPTVDAKSCTRCRKHKPASEFYRQNTSHDGLRSWCKTCYSSASAAKSKSSQKRPK